MRRLEAGGTPTDDLRTTAGLTRAYEAHAGEMYGFSVRALRDPQLAEDCVQEAFVRAWRAGDRFDPARGALRGWLFAILRNVVADQFAARARAAVPTDDGPGGPGGPGRPGTGTAGDAADGVLDAWLVEEALRRIREEHRVVIVETYYRGRSYAEVAQDLGIPVGTARSRAFYGLRALRVALLEMGWRQ